MKTIITDVNRCEVNECVFNADEMCHTVAINVGGPEPLCDTYINGSTKGGHKKLYAKVGACKVPQCMFNNSYECQAKGVSIVLRNEKAVCGTCNIE